MIDVDATTSEREAALAGLSQETLGNGYKLYLSVDGRRESGARRQPSGESRFAD